MTVQSTGRIGAEHAEFVERVRRFVAEEVAPHSARIDREAEYPREIYRRIGEEGLVGFTRPQGAGGTALEWAMWIEELAAASATVADVVCTADLVALVLDEHGTEEQKAYMGPLLAGETMGAFALTEAEAGSNAAAIGTVAQRDGDSYILTGTKAWITCAQAADWAIVLAKTDPDAGTRGISAFLIDRGDFSNSEPYDLMGQRGTAVGKLHLDGCRIPASAMVGEPGQGYKIGMDALDTGRIGIAAIAVGIARAAYEAAVEFAGRREQFGQKVSSFQGIRWMLVDMATDIEAARLLTHRAARLWDAGLGRHTTESAMAKLYASDVAMRVTVDALQVHGATGYSRSQPLERYVRDAKLTQIYEGTNQIQREVLARQLLGRP
jgi:alkylation response protein AidB-like acyl-CoA dehydrogenase